MTAESVLAGGVPADSPEIAGIRYFGTIREAAGKSDEEWSLFPDSTVYNLLQAVSDVYGDKMRDELFDIKVPGVLRDDLMVSVNEAVVNNVKAVETAVRPGDVVALFPIFPGGG